MAILLSIPIIGFFTILQSSIASQMPLLQGTVDLILLALIAWALQEKAQSAWQWSLIGGWFFHLASSLPMGTMIAGYLVTTALTRILRRYLWQVPMLAMLILTLFGTLITHAASIIVIFANGTSLPLLESLNLVTLPSLLLNMLLAIPMYIIMSDLSGWVYPKEIEV